MPTLQTWLWKDRGDRFLTIFSWAPVVLAVLGVLLIDGTKQSEEVLRGYLRLPSLLARGLEPMLFAVLWVSYTSLRAVTGEFTQLQASSYEEWHNI